MGPYSHMFKRRHRHKPHPLQYLKWMSYRMKQQAATPDETHHHAHGHTEEMAHPSQPDTETRMDAETTAAPGLPVDLVDDGDQFVVLADVPGYDTDDIEVTLVDETTVEIAIDPTATVPGASMTDQTYLADERPDRAASRTVTLPEPVVEEGTTASFDRGVLVVELSKADDQDDGAHTIQVN